jgi:hypothetical protein
VGLDTGELIVSFSGRAVTYGFDELDALIPACAALTSGSGLLLQNGS